jgi:hypothetical protein
MPQRVTKTKSMDSELFNDSSDFNVLEQQALELAELRQRPGPIIVTGPWGIGKTTLLEYFVKRNDLKYDNVAIFNGFELTGQFRFKRIVDQFQIFKKSLLIIEDFERVIPDYIKEEILLLFKEGRKYNIDIIMSVADGTDYELFERQSRIYRLEPLSEAASFKIISDILKSTGLHPSAILKLYEADPSLKYSTFSIRRLSRIMNQVIDVNASVIQPLIDGIKYKNSLFSSPEQQPLIITGEEKAIITEIKLIERDIIAEIKKEPGDIYKLTSRQFEELVVDMYRRNGFNVTLTKKTRDGGKDFIISNPSLLGNQLIYGECKKNRPDRPVGLEIIKQLHSTIMTDRATGGILVSSSYFSPDAQKFVQQYQHQLELIDFIRLNQMINELK